MKSLPFHGVILLEKSERLQFMDGTVHVALCAMAVEAFLQDLKSYYKAIAKLRSYTPPRTFLKTNPDPRNYGGGAAINGQMEYLKSSERNLEKLIDSLEKRSLINKYEEIIKTLNGVWDKDADELFKNLQHLITLRNNLVHIKSDEIELDERNNVSEHPAVVRDLLGLGILEDGRPAVSWVYMLDTEKLVSWARRTAIDIIGAILKIIPDEPISNNFKYSYFNAIRTFKF